MSLLTHLATIEDPRRDINKKHELLDILFLTVSGVLSGAEGWKDIKDFGDEKLEWLRRYRPFENGMPVDDTIARVVRAQLKSTGKKNEQESVMAMLDLLQVKGAHITADAMNTQKKIAHKIRKQGGDYTLSLKDNHKTLRKEIQAYSHSALPWALPFGQPSVVQIVSPDDLS